MTEATWSALANGSYGRPLLGSEAAVDMVSVVTDGYGDVCIGVSFKSTLADTEITDRTRDALLRLRYQSPLVAATLVRDGQGIFRTWNYKPASTYNDALDWARHALKVHPKGPSAAELIDTVTAKSLPYTADEGSLFFACHLVLRESGTHSVIFHGAHAIMDTKPTLEVLSHLMTWITSPPETPVSTLNWGTEWSNLPEGPVTSTGGPKEGHETEVASIVARLEELERRPVASKALVSQRSAIAAHGKAVHATRDISAEQSAQIVANVRALGLTVTTLFEAAQVLATFARNEITVGEEDSAHITLDVTAVALMKRLVPPHDKGHFVSAMAVVPLVVSYKDIKGLEPKAQMVALMKSLKKQYAEWTATPHLPMLSARLYQPTASNPYAGVITNVGIIEDILPRQWPNLELCDVVLGLRDSMLTRPCTHVWTFNSKMHVQVQGSDVFDQEYLQDYVDDIVKNAMLFL